jgi:hypothetical protein
LARHSVRVRPPPPPHPPTPHPPRAGPTVTVAWEIARLEAGPGGLGSHRGTDCRLGSLEAQQATVTECHGLGAALVAAAPWQPGPGPATRGSSAGPTRRLSGPAPGRRRGAAFAYTSGFK